MGRAGSYIGLGGGRLPGPHLAVWWEQRPVGVQSSCAAGQAGLHGLPESDTAVKGGLPGVNPAVHGGGWARSSCAVAVAP